MTTAEAAQELGLKAKSVCGAIEQGRLVATKCEDGTWDVDPASVHQYKRVRYGHEKRPSNQAEQGSGMRPGKSTLERAMDALGDCTREQLYQAIVYGYCTLADDETRRRVRGMIGYQQELKRAKAVG